MGCSMNDTKTKIEISAGGLIVTKVKNNWFILVMKDRKGVWTFPKGKIEKGEKIEETAEREIEEEVGIHGLSYRARLTPSQYWYYRNGAVKKTVYYLLFEARTRHKPTVQAEEGISEAAWIPLSTAGKKIGYPKTNSPLLVEAKTILSHL